MPWRLIRFIAVFAAFLLFSILNLENRTDVSLGFAAFTDVPVFLTAFCAFLAGMAVALPYIIAGRRKGKGGKTNGGGGGTGSAGGHGGDYGID